MDDPTNLRSKAEASYRLAEIAKTPRARELFRQLGQEYESRARGELTTELSQQMAAAPALAQVAPLVTDMPVVTDAPLAADVPVVADAPLVADTAVIADVPAVADTGSVNDLPTVADAPFTADVPISADASSITEIATETTDAPLAPITALSESEQFIATLRALRQQTTQG